MYSALRCTLLQCFLTHCLSKQGVLVLFVSSFSGRVEEWRGSRLEDFLRPWPTFLHAASDLPSAALVLAHRQHQLQHQRHRQHHIQALTKSRYPDPSRPENWKWPGTRKIVFQFKSNRTQHRMRNVANEMTLPTHPNTENHYLVIYWVKWHGTGALCSELFL